MTPKPGDDGFHAMFERLFALPRAQRAAALDAACAGNTALRQRIERLLNLADRGEGFLDRSPLVDEPSAASSNAYAPGRSIGAYRLLRCLGTGGMAEVWLAKRVEGGFRQQVAIKLIPHAPGRVGERFNVEREILASLTHPGIARLLDGGVGPDGLAYMVMEYVEGEHLVAWCQAHSLPLTERLSLFLQICDAAAYAHTRLVVHRDIKPANILVTAGGQAKLLDFGIAKLLDGTDTVQATRTLQLSPTYAAPEQLSGALVSTATDVYALGVTLFELLVGRLPWTDEATPLATAIRRLADAALPSPSRAVGTNANAPVPARALRGDLDAIVARALRREPEQRYPDARALADDIRRYLEHRPVQARTGARGYIVRRYLRRHWRALVLVAAVFAAMSGALTAITWQARKARLEAQRAEAVQSFMVDLFRTNSSNQPDPVKARATTARELLDTGARRIATQLDEAPENKLALLRLFGDLYYDLALTDETVRLRQQVVNLGRRIYGADSDEQFEDLLALSKALRDSNTPPERAGKVLDQAGAILDHRHEATSSRRARLLMASAQSQAYYDPAFAREAAAHAVAILDALPPSPLLAEALYTQAVAIAQLGNTVQSGDAAGAVALLQRAVEVSRATEGGANPNLVTYGLQLASTQGELKRFADAESSARATLADALAVNGGKDQSYAMRAEELLGEVLLNEEKFQQAEATLTKAKTTALRILPANESFRRPLVLRNTGRAETAAGAPEDSLADLRTVVDADKIGSGGISSYRHLEEMATPLLAMGRRDEALAVLDEARTFRNRTGAPQFDGYTQTLRIRAALDADDPAQARLLLKTFPVKGKDEAAHRFWTIRRDLLDAETALAENELDAAAQRAAEAISDARASALAPSLPLTIANGELLEGLARLRGGDAKGAQPWLAQALAARSELLLPQSPEIAEAQLALAECALALGRRDEAAGLFARAEAIEKQHSSLSARYRRPLEQLRMQLGKP